jgi:hypothetical protein
LPAGKLWVMKTKKILRSIGWFLRSILVEGNPGAGPAGAEALRAQSDISQNSERRI